MPATHMGIHPTWTCISTKQKYSFLWSNIAVLSIWLNYLEPSGQPEQKLKLLLKMVSMKPELKLFVKMVSMRPELKLKLRMLVYKAVHRPMQS